MFLETYPQVQNEAILTTGLSCKLIFLKERYATGAKASSEWRIVSCSSLNQINNLSQDFKLFNGILEEQLNNQLNLYAKILVGQRVFI